MKIIFIILYCLTLNGISNAQNYFTSKMAVGVHFNGQTDDGKKFKPGIFFSGYAEPRISNSGNVVFNVDYGIFKPDFPSTTSNNAYNVLVGYKQKFFSGNSDYYISALMGALFKGLGFKVSVGNEYRILKTSFWSVDFFYCRTVNKNAFGNASPNKVGSVFGITLGAGIFNK